MIRRTFVHNPRVRGKNKNNNNNTLVLVTSNWRTINFLLKDIDVYLNLSCAGL